MVYSYSGLWVVGMLNYIDGIYTSDYNISFYDIEHDGVINNK